MELRAVVHSFGCSSLGHSLQNCANDSVEMRLGLPNHPKYKPNFTFSQLPKSDVVAFGNWLYNLIVI